MLKRGYKLLFIIVLIFCGWLLWQSFLGEKGEAGIMHDVSTENAIVNIIDDGLNFQVFSNAKTVDEFFSEQKISLSDNDLVYPSRDQKIYQRIRVIVQRAKIVAIKENGKTSEVITFADTIEKALWENKNIILGDDDITVPARSLPVSDGMKIAVTHVLIKEEIKNVDIDFKTVTNEDDKLGWRIKKVTQKGEKGIKENKYRVVFNDGKEISRKILESNVTKQPVEEIVTQGTFVKVGKVHTGVASWYAWTGTLAAANPWLPMGSYVRVTNRDNGKSVIVKINDRGPFGNGRIIDLDKVAFAQIASVGAGTANIKMEVITN